MPITVRHDAPSILQQLLEFEVAGKQEAERERLRQEAMAWEREKFDRTMGLDEARFDAENRLRAAQMAQSGDQFYAGLDARERENALRAGMDDRQLAYQDAWNRDRFALDAAGLQNQSAYQSGNLALQADETAARREMEERRLAEDAYQSDRQAELDFAKQAGLAWGLTREEKQANLNLQQQMRTVWQAQNLNANEKQMAIQQLQSRMYPERWLSKEEREPSMAELFQEEVYWDEGKRPWVRSEDGEWKIARGYESPKPEVDKNALTDKDIASMYNDAFKALTKKGEDGEITTPSRAEILKYIRDFQSVKNVLTGGDAAKFSEETLGDNKDLMGSGSEKISESLQGTKTVRPITRGLAMQLKPGDSVVGTITDPKTGKPVLVRLTRDANGVIYQEPVDEDRSQYR